MYRITVKEAAEKWGVTVRRVQDLCKRGEIPGALRWERTWMIPADATYPSVKRKNDGGPNMPMPRKSPFLDMTDLYNTPGSADRVIAELGDNNEAQALFAAEIYYSRGEIDIVYDHVQYFLKAHSGFYAILGGGLLLSLVAMWRGDFELWRKAKGHIYEAPCKDDRDRDIVSLTLASADSAIRNTEDFPDWFVRGCFSVLPADSHPAARVYYLKYLLIQAQNMAMNKLDLADVNGLGLLKSIPYIAEPLISQARVEKTVISEIYLCLICAVAYQDIGDKERAKAHINRAIELALPDNLFGILAEHRRQLGSLLDDCLAEYSPEALRRVKDLHKRLTAGWTKLHNEVLERTVSAALSLREREVARLVAFGLSNGEIAERLHISKESVKSLITTIRNKTGITKRAEFADYV